MSARLAGVRSAFFGLPAAVAVALLVLLATLTGDGVTVPRPAASAVSAAPAAAAPAPIPAASASPSPSATFHDGDGRFGAFITTGGPAVALTFDDGPDPINTPRLLAMLRERHIHATFCMVGFRVRDRPDLVRAIYADGHTLCNHSWQHLLNLAQRDDAYIDWDLKHTNEMIRAAVGTDVPIRYFRAPGGNFTPALVAKARALGMDSISWDVDPRDWEHTHDSGAAAHIARVVSHVKDHTRPGSIVLSHDNGQPNTITAYQELLPWLQERFTLSGLPAAGL